MKILLDENLPHRLRPLLSPHEAYTVTYMGWAGIENGELLALAAENGFEAVITNDNGIPYEQNIEQLPCSVIVLQAKSNSLRDIRPLVPRILEILKISKPRSVLRIE